MDGSLRRCVEMLKENDDETREAAVNTLQTLCRKILSSPDNAVHREVRLDDPTVVDKLLPAAGAMECLLDVGFIEDTDSFVLPQEESLNKMEALQKLLQEMHSTRTEYQPIVAPPTTPVHKPRSNHFLDCIKDYFQLVLRYEDPALQEKAKELIPLAELEFEAVSQLRKLQKEISLKQHNGNNEIREKLDEPDICLKDLLLVRLMDWYKHKFFTWVDSPMCSFCSGECKYESTILLQNPMCSRVELHRCTECSALIRFPRYTDPERLLILRRGRCGEWAYVFTLMCRSLGYDARLVMETDHCWTEVWFEIQKRWVHIDVCENIIDQPLMYERGWNKKLSYVMAYSKDEVQDVTWRYTRDQDAVMKRRTLCSEASLLLYMNWLNKQRQYSSGYSSNRRNYVMKRRLLELAELIHTPNQKDQDDGKTYGGRTSGSQAWRLARGEISKESISHNHTWNLSQYPRTFRLQYFAATDVYKVMSESGAVEEQKTGWQNGVSSAEGGMFRKVETDWKVVYLARSSNSPSGIVRWSFEITEPSMCISSFSIRAITKIFHDATISWKVQGFFGQNESNSHELTIDNSNDYQTDKLKGATKIVLSATVAGGQGDTAWQHAQLFRQSINSSEQSMEIVIRQIER